MSLLILLHKYYFIKIDIVVITVTLHQCCCAAVRHESTAWPLCGNTKSRHIIRAATKISELLSYKGVGIEPMKK